MQAIGKLIQGKAWTEKVIFILGIFSVFSIPFQQKFYRALHPLFKKIASENFPFEDFFHRRFFYYNTDFLLVVLCSSVLIATTKSLKAAYAQKASQCLIAFYLFCLISILASPQRSLYVQYFYLAQLIVPGVAYCILSSHQIFSDSKKVVLSILSTLSLTALLQAVIAIIQYFSQHPVGLSALGEIDFIDPLKAGAIFEMYDGSLWLFDHLFSPSVPKVFYRSYGTLIHPNILGGFLALGILATLYLFVVMNNKSLRWVFSLSIPIQFFALLTTYSRAAWIGLFFAVILFFLLELLRTRQAQVKDGSVKKLLLVVLLGFSFSFSLLSPQILQRAFGKNIHKEKSSLKESEAERIILQKIAIRMVNKNPILGVGYKGFLHHMDNFMLDEEKPKVFRHVVHNVSLLIVSETGLLGLSAFLSYIFFLLFPLIKGPGSFERSILLSIFVAFACISFCDHYFISSQSGRMMFFLLMGLMALILASNRKGLIFSK